MGNEENKQKDRWDKAEVVSRFVGAILLPSALAGIGYYVNRAVEERRQEETKLMENQKQREERHRLFSQIMSQRETADSELRKDMFKEIIQSVVGKKDNEMNLRDQVLKLELLAHNFHDSIDLRALFYEVHRLILATETDQEGRNELEARLKSVAEEIRKRQFSVLSQGDNVAYFTVDLTQVHDVREGYGKPLVLSLYGKAGKGDHDDDNGRVEFVMLGVGKKKEQKLVRTQVLRKNEKTQELEVRLQIITRRPDETVELQAAEMWVGFYDFPMIDNIRLESDDQRCAVVLDHFEKGSAKISVVVFPACRASLKEKAYYEEYVRRLGSRGPGDGL